MNARVLELLQRPENISKEDISLLQKEISKFPYMQSIRTLQLSAIFNFEEENYQKELTKTAAYTTDKKILYNFINQKTEKEEREATKFKKIVLAKTEETKSAEIQQVALEAVSHLETEKPEISEPKMIIGDTELETPIVTKNENEFEVFEEEKQILEVDNEEINAKNIGDTELEVPIFETQKAEISQNFESATNIEISEEELEKIDPQKPVVTHPKTVIGDTELETPILDKKENEFEVLKEIQKFEEKLPFEIEEDYSENQPFKTREEDLNFSKETLLELDKDKEISAVKPSEISFNGYDSFLPDIKFTIPSAKKVETFLEPKQSLQPIENEVKNKEISFENVQNFEIPKAEETPIVAFTSPEKIQEEVVLEEEKPQEVISEIQEKFEEKNEVEISESEVHTEWKPMNFMMNPLDSTIKKTEISKPKFEEKPIEIKSILETQIIEDKHLETENVAEEKAEVEKTETQEVEERPVLNVSFLSENLQEIKPKISEEKPAEIQEEFTEIQEEEQKSNIPNFVNTWQTWLKIDRNESPKSEEIQPEIQAEKIIEKKADIIDKFIEENPRISQFKEDASYVVKEKADDISHLMTETLAKLYTTQRLYTKAIKAYEILQQKHPEKAEEFQAKIQEIKEKQGK